MHLILDPNPGHRFRTGFGVIAGLLAVACGKREAPKEAESPAPSERMSIGAIGLLTPESVLYDSAADRYLVSNIAGNPLEKDNNGFISRLLPDGHVETLQWIAAGAKGVTLNAPKGMAIKGDSLFVADIDVVRVFNRTTGALLGNREIPGATMLNDMTVGPDGTVYVTDSGLRAGPGGFMDSGTDAVYKFGPNGNPVVLTRGKELGRPNGITPDSGGGGLVVVTFGSGEVYRLDPTSGARTDLPKPPKGQLDGVEALGDGSLLISSWEGQAVYRLRNGSYTVAVDSVKSPADIGYDRKRGRLLIPIFMDNRIEIRSVR